MTLQDKTDQALATIDIALSGFSNPALMCSFGKDSMVLLHLVRQVRQNIPIIFHKEAFQPRRNAFANKIIHDWDLTVYDYPVMRTEVNENENGFEILNYYAIGDKTSVLPVDLIPWENGESFACGLKDVYQKPIGAFAYPWDLIFHGHKSSDIDPIHGAVPLLADFARNVNSVSAAFPIRYFTDADVWTYTERHLLPIHHERYEKVDGEWRERADKTHNPDYLKGCTACMRQSSPASVPCPKLNGRTISNVSAQLRRSAPVNLPYMGNHSTGE